MRSGAVGVEEADLLVETPVETARGVAAQALAFRRFCDVVEVVDLRLLITSHMLEVLAASLYNRWALWSCCRERAVRSVLAGGRVGGALLEEETVAWSVVVVEEGEEHELVAVFIRSTLLLALQLRWQVEYCSDNVGDRVKRAEEPVVEEITLAGFGPTGVTT